MITLDRQESGCVPSLSTPLSDMEPLSSLGNALQIVSLLGPDRPVLRVGEVCRDLGLPKSSVSRLLKALGESGLLERESDGPGYVAGRRALELGELYVSRHSLLDLIDHTIGRIVKTFGFAGYAGILSGRELVIIRVRHGSYPLRLVHPVGTRLRSFDTAIGQALLSRLSEAEAAEAVGSEHSADEGAVRQTLDEVYCSGVAQAESAVVPGIAAIGAAVRKPDGREAIGFSISFPVGAVSQEEYRDMALWIRAEAAAVAARIGDSYWIGRIDPSLKLQSLRAARRTAEAVPVRPSSNLVRSGS